MRLPPSPPLSVSSSRTEISQVLMISQPAPPFSPPVTGAAVSPHSPTHPPTMKRNSALPPNVFLALWVWFQMGNRCLVAFCVRRQSQETQREGQQQASRELWPHDTARSGVQDMMGNFWIPPWKTRQSWGCRSAVTWNSVWFMWVVLFCAQWLQAVGLIFRDFVSLFAIFLYYSWLFLGIDLHGVPAGLIRAKSPAPAESFV